jgi:photosystem II stability/assembly factor-like uncharacterized protein
VLVGVLFGAVLATGLRYAGRPTTPKPPAATRTRTVATPRPLARFAWSLPRPTGSQLNAICACDKVSYVVGTLGTIAKSVDGGPFALLESGTKQPLWGVWCASKDEVYAVGDNATLLHSNDGGARFRQERVNTSGNIQTVWGEDSDVVFVVSTNGGIFRSTDRGTTWTLAPSGTTEHLKSIQGDGKGRVYAVGDHGAIVRSDDKGLTWVKERSGTEMRLWSVSVADALVYVVGEKGVVLRKRGKEGFAPLKSGTARDLFSVFTDGKRVVAAGGAGTLLYAPMGDGALVAQTSNTAHDVYTVLGANNGDLWAVGEGGLVLRSAQLQQSAGLWMPQTTLPREAIFGIHGDAHGVYAVGERGSITRSLDRGERWETVPSSTTTTLTAVLSEGDGTVIAVGWDGTVVRSSDAGAHWDPGSSGTSAHLQAITRWHDALFVVGSSGAILKSTNHGESFRRVESGTKAYLDGVFSDEALLVALGPNGTMVSSTDGETWSELDAGTKVGLWGGLIDDAGTLHVGGEKCTYLRSTDRGRSWQTQKLCDDDATLLAMWGRSAQDLYIVASNGMIDHSTDGGVTWGRAPVDNDTKLYAIWGDGEGSVFAAGLRGVLRGEAARRR